MKARIFLVTIFALSSVLPAILLSSNAGISSLRSSICATDDSLSVSTFDLSKTQKKIIQYKESLKAFCHENKDYSRFHFCPELCALCF